MLAKHSKSFSLIDCISVGVDRTQRNFEPMRKQVEACQRAELTDVTAATPAFTASSTPSNPFRYDSGYEEAFEKSYSYLSFAETSPDFAFATSCKFVLQQ